MSLSPYPKFETSKPGIFESSIGRHFNLKSSGLLGSFGAATNMLEVGLEGWRQYCL